MRFYLGTHMVGQKWWDLQIPLFVSRRRLTGRIRLPEARAVWALDSGGFTELSMYGYWKTTENEYVHDVLRFEDFIGHLAWVAPMDWMCEPFMLQKTGRSVAVHQQLTVGNFLRLRHRLGSLVVPVLQGWTQDDYHNCWELYEASGVTLEDEPLVGLGSVCRRQNTFEIGRIVRSLQPLPLHGFGVKAGGLASFGDALASADSMAWSYAGRNTPGCGPSHKTEANCQSFALRWRDDLMHIINQQRLEFV